jgi:hypothetical protein
MTRAATKQCKAAIRGEMTQIRHLLKEWDPLTGSPADEYDCLVDGIVRELHRSVTTAGLADWIRREFGCHRGRCFFIRFSGIKGLAESWL